MIKVINNYGDKLSPKRFRHCWLEAIALAELQFASLTGGVAASNNFPIWGIRVSTFEELELRIRLAALDDATRIVSLKMFVTASYTFDVNDRGGNVAIMSTEGQGQQTFLLSDHDAQLKFPSVVEVDLHCNRHDGCRRCGGVRRSSQTSRAKITSLQPNVSDSVRIAHCPLNPVVGHLLLLTPFPFAQNLVITQIISFAKQNSIHSGPHHHLTIELSSAPDRLVPPLAPLEILGRSTFGYSRAIRGHAHR